MIQHIPSHTVSDINVSSFIIPYRSATLRSNPLISVAIESPPKDEGPVFHTDGTLPAAGWVWVFGSNEAGRHGKGAALVARQYFRAVYGVGAGMTGDSYAIPTKETDPVNERLLKVLPFDKISKSVAAFLEFTRANPTTKFFVTRIGCELANYSNEKIAPLFARAPSNCSFAQEWRTYIETPTTPEAKRSRSPKLP